MDVDDLAASGERESVAVRSSGALYMSASQKGSVSGRSRASSTIVQISPQRAAAAAAAEAEAQAREDAAALSPHRRAGRPRSSSMLVGSDAASLDDASPQQGRRRRPIPAGFSKVLQDATRVAEALGKAQRARKERGDRVTSLLEEQRTAAQGEAAAAATAVVPAAAPPAGGGAGASLAPPPAAVAAALVVDPAAFEVVDAGVEVEEEEGAVEAEEGWLAEEAAAGGGEEEEDDEAEWLLRAAEVEAEGRGGAAAAAAASQGARDDGFAGEADDDDDEDEDELPFLSSAEITEACEERVAALAAGEAKRSEAARQRLFFRGITVDDAQGKWTASDGRIGHYEPPPPQSSGAQGAGAGAGAACGVRQIDGEAYQRLLGNFGRDEDAAVKAAAGDDAMRGGGGGAGRGPSSSPVASPPQRASPSAAAARRGYAGKTRSWDVGPHGTDVSPPRVAADSSSPMRFGRAAAGARPHSPPRGAEDADDDYDAQRHDTSTSDVDVANVYDERLDVYDEEVSPARHEQGMPKRFTAGERLYFKGAAREQIRQVKLQQEREARVLEEMATISKGPVITQKAAAVKGDFIARQEEWAARVKREKEETRQRQEAARARTGDEGRRVVMSKRSEQLARRRGAPQGPVKEWDARFEKHCRAKTLQPAADTFQPRITAAAARLRNRGTAAERLHNDAVQRVSRHEARVIEQTERDMYDPQTGRPRYTPQAAGGGRDGGGGAGDASVCSRSNPPSPPGQMRGTILFTKAPRRDESVKENSQDSVVHRLLAHGQAAELKRNRRQNATEQEVQAGAHGAKLSKTTQNLVARMGERRPLYETAPHRGAGGVQHGSVLFSKSGIGAGSVSGSTIADCDTRTVCSTRSTASTSAEFAHRSAMHEQQRLTRLERLRQSKDSEELHGCTFQPSICQSSKTIFKKCTDRERRAMDTSSHADTSHADAYGYSYGGGGSGAAGYAGDAYAGDEADADADAELEEEDDEAAGSFDGRFAAQYAQQAASFGIETFQQYLVSDATEALEREDVASEREAAALPQQQQQAGMRSETATSQSCVDGTGNEEEDEEALLNMQTYYNYMSPAAEAEGEAGEADYAGPPSTAASSLSYAHHAQSAVQKWRRLSQQLDEEASD